MFFCIIQFFQFTIDTVLKSNRQKYFFKFHAAEHMLLNAYEDLNAVPTIDELRNYSRFRNSYGFLNFLQNYTTSILSDRELSVAIESIKLWLNNEKK